MESAPQQPAPLLRRATDGDSDVHSGRAATPVSAPAPTADLGASDPSANTHRCFVCLTDEPESSLPPDWSTPCTCSLEGHHDCLLDWIADLESQNKKLSCPVCKSRIHVIDRDDLVQRLGDRMDHFLSNWSPSILLSMLVSGTVVGSAAYGLEAIELFAGPEITAQFLFAERPENPLPIFLQRFPLFAIDSGWLAMRDISSVRLSSLLFLPLIGPALVMNRTNFPGFIALPTSLLLLARSSIQDLHSPPWRWPPTLPEALCMYTAAKTVYFSLYKRAIKPLEKRWSRVTRPQTPNPALAENIQAEGAQADAAPPADEEGNDDDDENDMGMNIEIELNIGDAPEPDPAEAAAAPDAAGAVPQDDAPGPGRRIEFGDRSPFNFLAGALMYPAVCYGVGELMRMLLPQGLVAKPFGRAATGILQERWGRSLVGGCLFVVIKDAFFLYVKYRRMMNRGYRRIKNSDKRNFKP